MISFAFSILKVARCRLKLSVLYFRNSLLRYVWEIPKIVHNIRITQQVIADILHRLDHFIILIFQLLHTDRKTAHLMPVNFIHTS